MNDKGVSGQQREVILGKALSIFHLPRKFQKIQLQIGIVVVYPKSQKSIYGTHNSLGVNS
jgi:hypothetical protein